MRIDVDTIVRAPAPAVFAAMIDIAAWPQTIRGIERVELLTPGPVAVGTRFRETRRMFGRSTSEDMAIAELDPPRRVVFSAHSNGIDYSALHAIEPVDGGCRASIRFEGRPTTVTGWLTAAMMWPFRGRLRQALRNDLDDIRRAVEAKAAGA